METEPSVLHSLHTHALSKWRVPLLTRKLVCPKAARLRLKAKVNRNHSYGQAYFVDRISGCIMSYVTCLQQNVILPAGMLRSSSKKCGGVGLGNFWKRNAAQPSRFNYKAGIWKLNERSLKIKLKFVRADKNNSKPVIYIIYIHIYESIFVCVCRIRMTKNLQNETYLFQSSFRNMEEMVPQTLS